MQPHLLTNFEIQYYYQNEPKFDGAYSRNNLLKIMDETYVNLNRYKSIEIYRIVLYVNDNNRIVSYDAIYFGSFRVKNIPKEVKELIRNKDIVTNIYRIKHTFW